MARIVMADDGISFDGLSLEQGPLGGAETAFVSLAEALARRGHQVIARNRCPAPLRHNGVDWAPLERGLPESADLYIANRGDKLLPLMPKARRTAFWIHNPAGYLMKPRYLIKLWRLRPVVVFIGTFHRATYPWWAPRVPCVVIPYGISEAFREVPKPAVVPPPRAIFTSNPMRSLDWLLNLWARKIGPSVAGAELHIFAGAATYGGRRSAEIELVLNRARAVTGVVVHPPLAKEALAKELGKSRVMLYRGDPGETFCLAIGEAQAVGLPCVVQDIGCVAERVIDGETGYVARDDDGFARAAIALLADDALWRRQSDAAWTKQRALTWDAAALAFERLIP
jgi:glycosyltransferase involved in cell wall biosynthesis